MIRAVIIDDEEAARELFAHELEEVARDINVLAKCSSFEQGLEVLNTEEVDIAFIDIIMPKGNGLDLLRSFPQRKFYPVMVTSHAQYAIDAIREEAFDYLLKPVDRAELRACLIRYRAHKVMSSSSEKSIKLGNSRLELKDRHTSVFLSEKDILYFEASGSYTTIYTTMGKYVESQNLKAVSALLLGTHFFRCSHQHVVNLKMVKSFSHDSLEAFLTDGSAVSVSVRKRKGFIQSLRKI